MPTRRPVGFKPKQRHLSRTGDPVQPSSRSALISSNLGILPAGFEEPGLLHSRQRFVQSPMGSEPPGVIDISEALGHLKTVKLAVT